MNRSATFPLDLTRFIDTKRDDASGTHRLRTIAERNQGHYYDAMVRRFTLQYVFPRGADNTPDRTVIDGAVKDVKLQLEALDRAYAQSDYLAGGQLPIADLLIAPILAYVENRPEGAQLMANARNVRRAQKILRARASFTETQS